MREDFRAVTRLPVMTQFLLAPLPALLAGLTYTAWRWTRSDWSQQYHVLGWTLMPLIAVTGALFTAAVTRGVEGRSSHRWLTATLLTTLTVVVLAYARSVTFGA